MKHLIGHLLLVTGVAAAAMLAVFYIGTATITDRLGEHEKKYYRDIEQVVYPAWLKAHPGSPLTFPEWDALRKQNLLPK